MLNCWVRLPEQSGYNPSVGLRGVTKTSLEEKRMAEIKSYPRLKEL
jgi:hypothetical protein